MIYWYVKKTPYFYAVYGIGGQYQCKHMEVA